MKNKDNFSVVAIRSFLSLEEAMICKSLLDSAGVGCELWNTQSATLIPYSGMNKVELVVSKTDEKKATDILNAHFDPSEFEAEEKAAEKETLH